MKKRNIYVLDTNVLLHNSHCIYKFENKSEIVIPMVVIEELDTFKKSMDETGRNSRQFSRILDELRKKGDISKGVKLENGSTIRVDIGEGYSALKPDNIILETAKNEKIKNPKKQIELITKDTNLRIKANLIGINSEDFNDNASNFNELYTGVTVKEVIKEDIDSFYEFKELTPKEEWTLRPNEYVVLKGIGSSQRGLARYDAISHRLVPLVPIPDKGIWGIKPKNLEQTLALDMLFNDDIKLVSLIGKAGTGKTLLTVAMGLYKSLDAQKYKKLIITRPVIPMGKDIGFLPGDIDEKMSPWMKPIMDNIDFLLGDNKDKGQELIEQGLMDVEPLTYIRGRSMPNQYIIIDEAQNLSPHEIKTIITRAGEHTKIVLTGDCYQIDNPYLDATSNGLSYLVSKFKDEKIAGHITLIKGERSELAEIASNLL